MLASGVRVQIILRKELVIHLVFPLMLLNPFLS